jgi:hypothetical protein
VILKTGVPFQPWKKGKKKRTQPIRHSVPSQIWTHLTKIKRKPSQFRSIALRF